MIEFGDSITVDLKRKAIKEELEACEWGSYEDHIVDHTCDRCSGKASVGTKDCRHCKGTGVVTQRLEEFADGSLHIVELLLRDKSKTKCELRNSKEVQQFFEAMCSGTFGLYHLRTLKRIRKELQHYVSQEVWDRYPEGSLGY